MCWCTFNYMTWHYITLHGKTQQHMTWQCISLGFNPWHDMTVLDFTSLFMAAARMGRGRGQRKKKQSCAHSCCQRSLTPIQAQSLPSTCRAESCLLCCQPEASLILNTSLHLLQNCNFTSIFDVQRPISCERITQNHNFFYQFLQNGAPARPIREHKWMKHQKV